MAGLIQHDGEIILARTAARNGIPFCLSTQSITSVGAVRAAVPNVEIWMQIYLWQDLSLSLGLLNRARAAQVRVLVLTVDTPYGARKPWNDLSGFGLPFRLSPQSLYDLAKRPGWLGRAVLPALLKGKLPSFGNYPEGLRPTLLGGPPDASVMLRRNLGWEDVAWLRKAWDGPILLKGVLSVEDAHQAVQAGANGLIVSSHGARNFDAAPAPIDRLYEIAKAVGNEITILSDSGLESGLDLLRFRLRGADAAMTGRLPLWALAAEGEAGVIAAIQELQRDYIEALDFAGLQNDLINLES
jgi:L-lactate dehydrogenase (cytochrome)